MTHQKTTSGRWKIPLKLFVVGTALYFLMQKGLISISLSETKKALGNLEMVVPAFGVLGIGVILGMVRWQWLLRAQGINLPWGRLVQLGFIGLFFNIALPGAVSGDFVKAFYIGRELAGQRARAFGSILFDRVAGISALVLVSAGALLVGFESFWGTPLFLSIQFLMTIAALAVLAFYSYLFLVREHHDPLLRLFHALGVRYPKTGSLERIYMGLRHYHNHRWTVIKVLLVSICIHLLVGWACFRLAMAMGDVVSQLAVYVVTPIGLLVTAIPVLPAGVGTGHAAFSILFKLIGSLRGADVFTLFVLFHLFIGSVGGLVYLRFRNTEPKLNFDSAALDADTLSPTTTR